MTYDVCCDAVGAPVVGAGDADRLAQAALAAHRLAQLEERDMFGDDYHEHDLILCYVDGDPLRPSLLSRECVQHTEACSLPPIRLHDMRQGACSLMLSGGVPIEVVRMILGHSSPAVTRGVYAHLMRRATARAVRGGQQAAHRPPP
jgi:integrase